MTEIYLLFVDSEHPSDHDLTIDDDFVGRFDSSEDAMRHYEEYYRHDTEWDNFSPPPAAIFFVGNGTGDGVILRTVGYSNSEVEDKDLPYPGWCNQWK